MSLRKHTFAALCTAAALAFAPLAADRAMAQDTQEITVAVPNPSALIWIPVWVAIGEGYFEEEGLSVNVEAVNGSAAVLQAMAAEQAQLGIPGPGPVLAAQQGGEDVVFIYNLYPKSLFGLVVREESEIQSPEQVEGTVVGVGTADGSEVSFVRTIFSDLGLQEGTDYEFLPVGDGGTASAAFLREEIQSYAAAISDAAIITARGIPLREITPEEYLGYFGNGVAALASYIEANPDVIEGFGRAMVRGMRFAMDEDNQEAVLAHAEAGNPQEGEDQELATSLLGAVVERMTPTDAYIDEGFGYQPPEHWELWHQSQVDSGGLNGPLPDLTEAYTNEFVETWNQGS